MIVAWVCGVRRVNDWGMCCPPHAVLEQVNGGCCQQGSMVHGHLLAVPAGQCARHTMLQQAQGALTGLS